MRLLLALGILGGATWIAYAFVPAECAPPTADTVILCNRLWTPALGAMAAGFLGLRRWLALLGVRGIDRTMTLAVFGALLLVVGNAAEYWLFFSWPQQGPDGWLRGGLWVAVLLGFLALLFATLATGLALLLGRRAGGSTLAMGVILVTVPCFTVFIGPLAVGALAVIACGAALLARPPAPAEAVAEAVAEPS
jgi:hypothetical protein